MPNVSYPFETRSSARYRPSWPSIPVISARDMTRTYPSAVKPEGDQFLGATARPPRSGVDGDDLAGIGSVGSDGELGRPRRVPSEGPGGADAGHAVGPGVAVTRRHQIPDPRLEHGTERVEDALALLVRVVIAVDDLDPLSLPHGS